MNQFSLQDDYDDNFGFVIIDKAEIPLEIEDEEFDLINEVDSEIIKIVIEDNSYNEVKSCFEKLCEISDEFMLLQNDQMTSLFMISLT